MARAHYLRSVWMNRSALPLVRSVQGLVRMCLSPRTWQALATYTGPLSIITLRHSIPWPFPFVPLARCFGVQIRRQPKLNRLSVLATVEKSMEQPGDMAQQADSVPAAGSERLRSSSRCWITSQASLLSSGHWVGYSWSIEVGVAGSRLNP